MKTTKNNIFLMIRIKGEKRRNQHKQTLPGLNLNKLSRDLHITCKSYYKLFTIDWVGRSLPTREGFLHNAKKKKKQLQLIPSGPFLIASPLGFRVCSGVIITPPCTIIATVLCCYLVLGMILLLPEKLRVLVD